MFAWADQNGDGRVQAVELTFATLPIEGKPAVPQSDYWGQLPGPDGRFTVTPQQYREALRRAQASVARAAEPRSYRIRRARRPPVIDGGSDDWPELLDDHQRLIEVQESPQRRFARIQARYDDQHLYLACRVLAASDRMRNAGQDQRLLFKTGDGVDLMLGPAGGAVSPTRPPAPASAPFVAGSLWPTPRRLAGTRPTPRREERPLVAATATNLRGGKALLPRLRLLMTVAHGRPTATLYRKTVPGTPASERVPFSSPWRTVSFDQVKAAPTVRLATGRTQGGYFPSACRPRRTSSHGYSSSKWRVSQPNARR